MKPGAVIPWKEGGGPVQDRPWKDVRGVADKDSREPADRSPRARLARPGDLGRRVALRREELGLSREDVAAAAGIAPRYLQYLEERPADVSPGAVIRLAGVLQTTVSKLYGGGVDVPPGTGGAAAHPELLDLGTEECRERLGSRGVGRVVQSTPRGPEALPVNYAVVSGAIVYRTVQGTAPDPAPGEQVAFEVDQVDDALSQGWSVLVSGTARHVTDPEEVRRLAEQARIQPWPGDERDLWVRIEPARFTGRRIRTRTAA